MQPKLNIYICSTVRHLLFALLRAARYDDQQHHPIFFSNYQEIDLSDWDLTRLPGNVHYSDVNRHSLRAHLKSSATGNLVYFLAMRNLAVPGFLRDPIHSWVSTHTGISNDDLVNEPALWLFNERNKMSRVFRLLVKQFAIIEDGEVNYRQLKIKWWQWAPRMLLGRTARYRVFGEDPRCKEVWVLKPQRLPHAVKNKGREIDFIAGDSARTLIRSLLNTETAFGTQSNELILATQPIELLPDISIAQKQQLYARIVQHLQQLNCTVFLKIHPSEDPADYHHLDGITRQLPGKVPLEALILSTAIPIPVVSIMSTAGMGFEQYCRRIQLCTTSYSQDVPTWTVNENSFQEILDKYLTAEALG